MSSNPPPITLQETGEIADGATYFKEQGLAYRNMGARCKFADLIAGVPAEPHLNKTR